jgi:hypothetical protein
MSPADHAAWVDELLRHLDRYGPEGTAALAYIQQHGTKVGVHDQPTGARWTIRRRLQLHPRYAATPADEVYAVSLVIHEVRHLQQGRLTALSVYGEMEAWQLQFGFLKRLLGHYHADPQRAAILEQLMQLPLGWDRHVLQHVRQLMQSYAGKRYRIDLLPLYPLHREIAYRLSGRRP